MTNLPFPGVPPMSTGATKVVRVFMLEKQPDEVDHTRAGVYMPIGSEIVRIIEPEKGKVGVVATCPPEGARVWHPMIIAPMDQPVTPLIGRQLGPAIGIMPFPNLLAVMFPELPWPSSEVEGLPAEGQA